MKERKPYIHFYEGNYEGDTIEEKVKAFKDYLKYGIYHLYGYLDDTLEKMKKYKYEGYKTECDFYDYGIPVDVYKVVEIKKIRESWVPTVNPKPEEEQGMYEVLMESLELKELAEEFIKEDPENYNFISIIKATNEIFSYVPKEEYDKVYEMYHRIYYGSELKL